MNKIAVLLILLWSSTAQAFDYGSGFDQGDLRLRKNSLQFDEVDVTPPCPPTPQMKIYAKDSAGTTTLYTLDSNCTETALGAGGGAVSGANPSASAGLAAVNGSATTFLRSDGAPALSQGISPTWTGNHIFAPSSGNTLFSAGNVGIGTTVPQNVLSLGGSLELTGGISQTGTPADLDISPATNVRFGRGTNNTGFNVQVLLGTNSAVIQHQLGGSNQPSYLQGNNGNLAVGYAPGQASAPSPGAKIGVVGSIGIGTGASSAFIVTAPPNGGMIIQGNLGINTITPGAALQIGNAGSFSVSSTGAMSIGQGFNINTAGQAINVNAANTTGLNGSSGTAGSVMTITGNSGTTGGGLNLRASTGANTTDFIQLSVGSASAPGLRVQNSPLGINVGIGTFLPQNRLAVNGGVGIGTANSTYVSSSVAPPGGMIVQGNVGIGSFAPQATLDLGTSGTLVSHSVTGLGFSEHNATNQACNTTCGSSACVVGLDIGTVGVINSGFVACSDATADDCLCAGP